MKNKLVRNKDGLLTLQKKPTYKQIESLYKKEYYKKTSSKTYKKIYSKKDLKFIEIDFNISQYFLKGKKNILDIGCGEGFLINFFLKKNYKCFGVDITDFGIKKQNPKILKKIKFEKKNIVNENFFDDKKFDVIFLMNVAEHIIDLKKLLVKINKKLNKNGIFIIKVPNEFNKIHTYYQKINKLKKEELFIFNPLHHVNYFSKNSLINTVTRHTNLKLLETYSDFPIEMFLLNSKTNFYKNKLFGKIAHDLRIDFSTLLMEKNSIPKIINFYKNILDLGIGRSITGIFKKN